MSNVTVTTHVPESRFSFLSDVSRGRHELRMLGINNKHLSKVETLADLKALAKKQYHKISRYLHPDAEERLRSKTPRQRPPGQTFQTVTVAYQWVMGLKDRDIMQMANKPRQKYLYRDRRFYGSVSVLRGTVYDCPLPWHFERHVDCGYGYQESFDYIMYQ